jgi:hypothetical protein
VGEERRKDGNFCEVPNRSLPESDITTNAEPGQARSGVRFRARAVVILHWPQEPIDAHSVCMVADSVGASDMWLPQPFRGSGINETTEPATTFGSHFCSLTQARESGISHGLGLP